jgi:hypothetical protein
MAEKVFRKRVRMPGKELPPMLKVKQSYSTPMEAQGLEEAHSGCPL